MSKKITHEQMREHFKGTFNINDVKYEDIRLITNYIIQQEKQEKLLELYKELNNVWRNRFDYNNSESYIMLLEERIKYIEEEQIKEQENE